MSEFGVQALKCTYVSHINLNMTFEILPLNLIHYRFEIWFRNETYDKKIKFISTRLFLTTLKYLISKKINLNYRLIGRHLTCAPTAKLHQPSRKTHHHYLQMHSTPHTNAVTALYCLTVRARNPPLKVCQTEACHFNTSLACLPAADATRVKLLTKA